MSRRYNRKLTAYFSQIKTRAPSVKPDREIFLQALQECRVPAERIYFFDDCVDNVRTAQDLSINAIHVTGFSSLVQSLCRHQLIFQSGSEDEAEMVFAVESRPVY